MGLLNKFSQQFRLPSGVLGEAAGYLMAATTKGRNQWTISQLEIKPEDILLEIGYGPGVGIKECSALIESGKIEGIDISTTMKKQAERKNKQFIKQGKVKLLSGTVKDLPSEENTYDKIFSVNSVMFWEDQAEAFNKLYTLLNEGGKIAVTYQPMFKGAKEEDAVHYGEELQGIMKSAGFRDIRTELKQFKPVAAICVIGCKGREG
ncbi:class I SAM-dependent methyltransferase [Halobacillus andaensis]|uniref:class I SAM-dependent methyltransferase n=1 Tax=Halobacillus andaensis TaxID=1176239 RepID=UPI003D7050CA